MIHEPSGGLPPIPFRAIYNHWLYEKIPATAHPGLVFDRFAPLWKESASGDWTIETRELESMAKGFQATRLLLSERLKEHHERFARLVRAQGGGIYELTTASRLAIGLGADHPSENGLCLDPTLGVPYLPGSSLKGLCRMGATLAGMSANHVIELFGRDPTDAHANDQTGRLVFLAAYPKLGPTVDVDVVNCHLPTWYRAQAGTDDVQSLNRSSALPTDNPVPISFLTVASNTRFVFYLMSRATTASARKADLRTGFAAMAEALQDLGIGAKTASGYGVFQQSVSNLIVWMNATEHPQVRRIRRLIKDVPGGRYDIYLNPKDSKSTKAPTAMDKPMEKLDRLVAEVMDQIPLPKRIFFHGAAPPSNYCYLGYRLAFYSKEMHLIEQSADGELHQVRFAEDSQKSCASEEPLPPKVGVQAKQYVALCICNKGMAPDLESLEALAHQQEADLHDFQVYEIEASRLETEGRSIIVELRQFFSEHVVKANSTTGYIISVSGSDALAFATGHALGETLGNQPHWRVLLSQTIQGDGAVYVSDVSRPIPGPLSRGDLRSTTGGHIGP